MLVALVFLLTPCFADQSVSLKGGLHHVKNDGMDQTGYYAGGYQYKYKWFALESELGIFTETLYNTDFHKQMGRLYVFNIQETLKYYPWEEGFYAGTGIGYYITQFEEYYIGKATVDDEFQWHIVAGYENKDGLFLDIKYTVADLDIESGVFPDGILEDGTRLNSWTIMVGKRIKI